MRVPAPSFTTYTDGARGVVSARTARGTLTRVAARTQTRRNDEGLRATGHSRRTAVNGFIGPFETRSASIPAFRILHPPARASSSVTLAEPRAQVLSRASRRSWPRNPHRSLWGRDIRRNARREGGIHACPWRGSIRLASWTWVQRKQRAVVVAARRGTRLPRRLASASCISSAPFLPSDATRD